MHWHWQNLNERQDGTHGSGVVNGRAWWHFNNARRSTVGVQWVFHRRFEVGARVERGHDGGEHDFSASLHLLWFSLYLHTERVMPRWWTVRGYTAREYALRFEWEDWRIQWAWGGDPMSWSSRDPWWKNGSRSLKDTLLGRRKYREGEGEAHRIVVHMPERSYTGTCVMRNDSWKRPLWFREVVRRAVIDMDEGEQIPIPGKGESAWDCGEDATFGMTCPAATVEEAVTTLRESTMQRRERYGGPRWRPAMRASA